MIEIVKLKKKMIQGRGNLTAMSLSVNIINKK